MSNSSSPFFSVVIPTYNRAGLIGRALDSLVVQTFKDFEVLVCDDGSTDNTAEVVKGYNGKLSIQYLVNENGAGPSRPRNNGIKNAIGQWVCFLDSDDTWSPSKLEKVKEHSVDFDFIYHDVSLIAVDKGSITHLACETLKQPILDSLLFKNSLITTSVSVRRTVLLAAGGFSEAYFVAEDYDLWLRIASITNRFYHLKQNLAQYHSEGDNLHYHGYKMYQVSMHVLGQYKLHPLYAKAAQKRMLLYFPYLAIFQKAEAIKIYTSVAGFNLSFLLGALLLLLPKSVSKLGIRLVTNWYFKRFRYLADIA